MNDPVASKQPDPSLADGKSSTAPAFKSTAFWVGVALAVAAFSEKIAEVLPPERAVQAAALAGAIYKLAPLIKNFIGGGSK